MRKISNPVPRVGFLKPGPTDSIADIGDVSVGHVTLADQDLQTGVTVIKVHNNSHWLNKIPAAATVFNGYGKSVGLMQVAELGVMETPIALTNTFSVSAVAHGQIEQAIVDHPDIGKEWTSVNPLVFECSDARLNQMQALAVRPDHYRQALSCTSKVFAQGAVGAGRGMSCFGLKGGVGSASRRAGNNSNYLVGALVLSNFGKPHQIQIPGYVDSGRKVKAYLEKHHSRFRQHEGPERGSIIIILATDAPLDSRQLRRLSMRAVAGLARTGSMIGHGSGDIALAFSTAYTIPHHTDQAMPSQPMLHEQQLDGLFEAAAEATEQAIWSSLWRAETVIGRDGNVRFDIQTVLAGIV